MQQGWLPGSSAYARTTTEPQPKPFLPTLQRVYAERCITFNSEVLPISKAKGMEAVYVVEAGDSVDASDAVKIVGWWTMQAAN